MGHGWQRGDSRTRWAAVVTSTALIVLVLAVGCGDSNSTRGNKSTSTKASPVPTLDGSLVSQGQQIYSVNCASCHGPNAEGDPNWQTPNDQGNLPPPPHDDSGHTWRHGDGELFEIVHDGWRDPFNKTEDLTMPPFGEVLTDQEIQAVITFLKSLWSDEHRRFQMEESEDQPFPTPDGATS